MVDPDFERLLNLEKRLFSNVDSSKQDEFSKLTQVLKFGAIGLILAKKLVCRDYYCTPQNSLTFANTGGDGIHFGFLQIDKPWICPVVITVPMGGSVDSRDNNVILGETLREFLALGFHIPYFELEELVYDFNGTLHSLNQPEPSPSFDGLTESSGSRASAQELEKLKKQTERLVDGEFLFDQIVREFDLKPWENIEHRLEELRQRYLPILQIEDFEVWAARNKFDY